jgi:hypothetical protein
MGRALNGETKSGATVQSILEEMYEWSQLRLARAYSFMELDVRDTTTADTADGTMIYSFTTLFGAGTRTKDILSIVIEDGTSSNKLRRYLHRDLLKSYPSPESESESKPTCYTRVADDIWLFPVPDDTYDIHTIRSKWPTRATGDASLSDFSYKDDLLIVGTVIEFFNFYQEFKDAEAWNTIWKAKLKEVLSATIHPTDWEPEGRAFNSSVLTPGDFWANPLVMRNI